MLQPTDRKMTFIEFVASEDSDDGQIDESWLKHWNKYIPTYLNEQTTKEHFGDCTKDPCPCNLCVLGILLQEYKDYFFETQEMSFLEACKLPDKTKFEVEGLAEDGDYFYFDCGKVYDNHNIKQPASAMIFTVRWKLLEVKDD